MVTFRELAMEALQDEYTREAMMTAMERIYKIASERNRDEVERSLEAVVYNNYLTHEEAKAILATFHNADGTMGAKWSCDDVERWLKSKSLPHDEMPYYNFYALAVAMNRISSDYGVELKELTDDYALACYTLALCDLKDIDRPRWIREYFEKMLDK